MVSQPSDAEILVHITAPSKASDDAVYRQIAQAYLDFRPRNRVEISFEDPSASNQPSGEQAREQPTGPSSQEFDTNASGYSFEINSQDLSFNGALDNRFSPRIRVDQHPVDNVPIPSFSQESGIGSQTSWCTPPSQISDSYPLPDANVMYTSPTRVLQRYIGRQTSQAAPPASPLPAQCSGELSGPHTSQIDVPSSLPDQRQDEEAPADITGARIDARKIIPVTPLTSGSAMRRERETAVALQPAQHESIFDVTHISSTDLSVAPCPSRAESEPLPARSPKRGRELVASLDLVRSSSNTGQRLSSSNQAANRTSNSLEILPPSPPAGIADLDPSDLISDKLAKLARDLSSRYRAEAKRDIDPFERGFWLLDCTAWTAETRLDTWVFLNNYLRSGLAGWGTWCRRDEAYSWIRLYCWGHVAKHTYLLLYLASGRQLKTTGASWFGADGKLVVEVPPYERQG